MLVTAPSVLIAIQYNSGDASDDDSGNGGGGGT